MGGIDSHLQIFLTSKLLFHILVDFHAIASRIVLLNQAVSLWGAWKQATRRQLLHGAKADGEGG